MTEFDLVGGGGSPPSSKKFKVNKKNIILIGGGVLAIFFLVTVLMRGRTTDVMTTSPSPLNDADTQAMLQNNQSIMEGRLDSVLNSFGSEIASELASLRNDFEKLNAGDGVSSKPDEKYFLVQTGALTKEKAERLWADLISKGATNTSVHEENGGFRVYSKYVDVGKASKIAGELKKESGVVYTEQKKGSFVAGNHTRQ
jgi:hypothetical protein